MDKYSLLYSIVSFSLSFTLFEFRYQIQFINRITTVFYNFIIIFKQTYKIVLGRELNLIYLTLVIKKVNIYLLN